MTTSGIMDMENEIFREIQCPICHKFMGQPIFYCVVGHSICDKCFYSSSSCPTCGQSKSDIARVHTLAGVQYKLILSCRFKGFGCKIMMLCDELENHERNCNFIPMICPIRDYTRCNWVDNKSKLKSHLIGQHRPYFFESRQQILIANFRDQKQYSFSFGMYCFDEMFFRMTWCANEENGFTRWGMYFIGDSKEAENYCYKLEFIKDSNGYGYVPLTYKSKCFAAPTRACFLEHHYFLVHKTLLNECCAPDGSLKYRVTISEMCPIDEDLSDSENDS